MVLAWACGIDSTTAFDFIWNYWHVLVLSEWSAHVTSHASTCIQRYSWAMLCDESSERNAVLLKSATFSLSISVIYACILHFVAVSKFTCARQFPTDYCDCPRTHGHCCYILVATEHASELKCSGHHLDEEYMCSWKHSTTCTQARSKLLVTHKPVHLWRLLGRQFFDL